MGRRPREGTWVAFKTSRAAWLCERLRRVGHLSLYLASPLTAQKKGDSSSREHSTSLSVRESILANRRPSSPKVSCVPHAKTPPPQHAMEPWKNVDGIENGPWASFRLWGPPGPDRVAGPVPSSARALSRKHNGRDTFAVLVACRSAEELWHSLPDVLLYLCRPVGETSVWDRVGRAQQ